MDLVPRPHWLRQRLWGAIQYSGNGIKIRNDGKGSRTGFRIYIYWICHNIVTFENKEMIWNDMKWYDMIWNDMKWCEIIQLCELVQLNNWGQSCGRICKRGITSVSDYTQKDGSTVHVEQKPFIVYCIFENDINNVRHAFNMFDIRDRCSQWLLLPRAV